LEDVLQISNPKEGSWVKADKGYKSADNDKVLKKMKQKIMLCTRRKRINHYPNGRLNLTN